MMSPSFTRKKSSSSRLLSFLFLVLLLFTFLLLFFFYLPPSPSPSPSPSSSSPVLLEASTLIEQAKEVSSSFHLAEQQVSPVLSSSSSSASLTISSSDSPPSPSSVSSSSKSSPPKRDAIVTLLSSTISTSGVRTDSPTVDSFALFIATLSKETHRYSSSFDIRVLITHDFDEMQAKRVETYSEEFNFDIERVEAVTIHAFSPVHTVSPHELSLLSHEMTKLHLWKLTRYQRVLFVDVKSVFLRDPTFLFRNCPPADTAEVGRKDVSLCAQGRGDHFFSGLFLLDPSFAVYDEGINVVDSRGDELVSMSHLHALQRVLQPSLSKWSSLGDEPLVMSWSSPYQEEEEVVSASAVCVTGKLSELFLHRGDFFPWNRREYKGLMGKLPSVSGVIRQREKKEVAKKNRHGRLRSGLRSSRLGR